MGGKEFLGRLGHRGAELGHLRRGQLVALLEGGLQPDRLTAKHLEECVECQSKLAKLRMKRLFNVHPETELTLRYVEGELTTDEVQGFERHLAACSSCRDEVASVKRAIASDRDSDPPTAMVEPPAALLSATARQTRKLLSTAREARKALRRSASPDVVEDARSLKSLKESVALFDQSSELSPMSERHPTIRSLGAWRVVLKEKRAIFVSPSTSPSSVDKHLKEAEAQVAECFEAMRQSAGELHETTEAFARQKKFALVLNFREPELKALMHFQKYVQSFDKIVSKQAQMVDRVDNLLQKASKAVAQEDMLPFQLPGLEVGVTGEPSLDPPGIALTVTILRPSSGRHAAGILVLLDSENEAFDRLTDVEGRVVFPPVRGPLTLQLGHYCLSLDLQV